MVNFIFNFFILILKNEFMFFYFFQEKVKEK